MKICLTIIFNHRYDDNIKKLKRIYRGRFSEIRFIVPFYDLSDEDVIPVFESSYNFQGYLAQARNDLLKVNCDSYFIIADDMIINPQINENNIESFLGVQNNVNYCSGFNPLAHAYCWKRQRIQDAIDCFNQRHTNYENELLPKDKAIMIAEKYGLNDLYVNWKDNFIINNDEEKREWLFDKVFRIKWKDFYNKISFKGKIKMRLKRLILWKSWGKELLPYPLFYGYSDWFIITKNDFGDITKAFGVTAAMGLFVEIAVPTVLVLYSSALNTSKSLKLNGEALWGSVAVKKVEEEYNFDLNQLLNNFPQEKMYYHPIKLSKWKYNYDD